MNIILPSTVCNLIYYIVLTNMVFLTATKECTFRIIGNDNTIITEIPFNSNIGDVYDQIREFDIINKPFDLVYSRDGVDGIVMNKNALIDLTDTDFYVRFLSSAECSICYQTGLIINQSCNHNSICDNCYHRVNTCPFCRREYIR